MSSTISLPPHEQLYIRYCSNKHTHELLYVTDSSIPFPASTSPCVRARTQGCVAVKAASCSSRDQASPHSQCPRRSSISASGLQPLKPLASLHRLLLAATRRPMTSSHHADIRWHAPPEKYFLGVCMCVCVCVVDVTYDSTIVRRGERNRMCESLGCWVTVIWSRPL